MLQQTTDIHEKIKSIIDSYLNAEIPKTIKKEYVKSIGEAKIANFLFCHNISYTYEKVYKELMNENKVYRPDFTIHVGGEDIYIEYFGLSNYQEKEMNRYNEIRRQKENYHKTHHTKFIALDYLPQEDYLKTLEEELKKLGVPMKRKTEEEIYLQLLDNNPFSNLYSYQNFLYRIINLIKSSSHRKNYTQIIEEYIKTLPKEQQTKLKTQISYIQDFYHYYQSNLYGGDTYGFDFDDLIYYATLYVEQVHNKNLLGFKHIIIDEYQDISFNRYEFTRSIALQNHAKITAVGDDWQTIFSFAGSKIDYIYNFQKYFKGAKVLHISNTYRNSQELINYSGAFIMKNESQIKKDLISSKKLSYPIQFVEFENGMEYEILKKLIVCLHKRNKKDSILILGRTNQMIERCFEEPELKDALGTKIIFQGMEDLNLDGMTIHKAKGLTYDQVILIGLSNYWPREISSVFWLQFLLEEKAFPEKILYPEERRLFYVALTRTKNYVYLLVNKDKKKRSPFIVELAEIISKEAIAKE